MGPQPPPQPRSECCVLSECDTCRGNRTMKYGKLYPVLPLLLNSTDFLFMMEISM